MALRRRPEAARRRVTERQRGALDAVFQPAQALPQAVLRWARAQQPRVQVRVVVSVARSGRYRFRRTRG